ncbi:hypothetical protein BH11PSE12_BH11PSE12_30760 [soil metagenome]
MGISAGSHGRHATKAYCNKDLNVTIFLFKHFIFTYIIHLMFSMSGVKHKFFRIRATYLKKAFHQSKHDEKMTLLPRFTLSIKRTSQLVIVIQK